MLLTRLFYLGCMLPVLGAGQDGPAWNIHFQATSIGQAHGAFRSPYEGDNSLPPVPERRVSITATVFLSIRLSPRWEFVVNPEVAGGRGFGGVTGIAGFTNGEIPRVAGAAPKLYPARAYVRYTIPLGTEIEHLTGGPNQVEGAIPARRLSVITGKFALTDFVDANSYSHDPRTQFMNWSIMYNGAWDYPADTRGYTMGTLQELRMPGWALRTAVVAEPTTPNGPTFDTRAGVNRGMAAEYERDYALSGRAGAIRLLAFRNQERSGNYREAMRLAEGPSGIASIRRNGAAKYGFGANMEQALSSGTGVFARYGWSDGKTESWAFTEIDRSLSGGVSVKGRHWRREQDTVGLAAVRNWISGDHRSFLGAGGYGFIIGDGRIHYAPESIVETYYSWHAAREWTLTLDYQRVENPAYNRDRGPVSVATLRVHWER